MHKPVKQISRHGLIIGIKQFADGRFGFDKKDEHGAQIRIRHRDLEDAEQAAIKFLEAGTAGSVDLQRIDRDDYLQFLQWRAAKGQARIVSDLVAEFLAEKKRHNVSFWTMRDYKSVLDDFAEHFDVTIGSITRKEVLQWLDGKNVGPRRWNNLLAPLKSLCVWARKNRVLTAELHDIETIQKKRIRNVVQTYTVDQMETLLRAVEPDWLPIIALGAFAGVRPEEVCPDPRSGKQGLRWGDIDFRRGKVVVPANVSKTRRKRFIPINDALLSFLDDPKAADQPIAPVGKSFQNQMRRWPKPWIRDGLRHSYASYRLALTQDIPALSLEMGNSVDVIRNHYLDLKFEEEGEKWFSLRKI